MRTDEDIERVRAATDIVELVGSQTQLRRSGSRMVALCPFHAENTPSFSVNITEGLYYCFGCQESGDCFTFVQKIENLTFPEALQILADRAGITLSEKFTKRSAGKRKPVLQALKSATEWYHQQLLSADSGGPARKYLRSRGYGPDQVRAWRLGWAPNSWDAIQHSLSCDVDILRQAGLVRISNRGGRPYDIQRGRIIFPISNHKGEVVAFGGRILPPDSSNPDRADGSLPEAKYINSPETALYKKSKELFGLDKAKAEISRKDQVVIAEGYTDVIGLHEIGIGNAVATCGTALTQQHLQLLKRFTSNLVLVFDPDDSGQRAAERLHSWQSSLQLKISIVDIVGLGDPGEIAEKFMKERATGNLTSSQHEDYKAIFARTQEYLQFRIDRTLGGGESEVNQHTVPSPEQRLEMSVRAAKVIGEHPERTVRNHYITQLCIRMGITEERLREETNIARTGVADQYPGDSDYQQANLQQADSQQAGLQQGAMQRVTEELLPSDWRKTEEQVLLVLCHHPELCPGYLDESLLELPLHKEFLRQLLQAVAENPAGPENPANSENPADSENQANSENPAGPENPANLENPDALSVPETSSIPGTSSNSVAFSNSAAFSGSVALQGFRNRLLVLTPPQDYEAGLDLLLAQLLFNAAKRRYSGIILQLKEISARNSQTINSNDNPTVSDDNHSVISIRSQLLGEMTELQKATQEVAEDGFLRELAEEKLLPLLPMPPADSPKDIPSNIPTDIPTSTATSTAMAEI